jgi:glycopeptide antibiotics resistance protein
VESIEQLARVFWNQLSADGIQLLDVFSPQLALFLLLVVPSLTALLLYRRRRVRLGKAERLLPPRLALNIGLACTLLGVVLITLSTRKASAVSYTGLVPFHPLWTALTGEIDTTKVLATYGANILLFVPLGVLLPLRWPRLDSATLTTVAAGMIAAVVETLQHLQNAGRVTQLDDVIFNALGGLAGWAIMRSSRAVSAWFKPAKAQTQR